MHKSSDIKTILKQQLETRKLNSYGSWSRSFNKNKNKNKEAAGVDLADIEDSIVAIFCPLADDSCSTITGFIIRGNKVLTNAHSLKNHCQFHLRKIDSSDVYAARVLAIGTDCDLALLTVDDDEFWKGVSPVEFGSLPTLGDEVTVVGYPKTWNSACVTGAFVSRIDMFSYVPDGSTKLLCLQMQVDMSLRDYGAPAFNDKGQCVGVSLPPLKEDFADKICSFAPASVVMHFIEDYEKSKEYTGFPVLGFKWQEMQNAGFREIMGMTPRHKDGGIMVTQVDPTSPTAQYLKPSDIILKIDGVRIGWNGTVPFELGGLISLSYLVSQKYTGDTAVFEVLRASKVHHFNLQLGTH